MAIEYFCCYHSYGKKCGKLTDEELGRLFRALMKYSETGERETLGGLESIAFDFIADDIDRAKAAYAEKCRKNRENGALGGRTGRSGGPRLGADAPQTKDKDETKDEGKDEDKDKDKGEAGGGSPGGEETPAGGFVPPTLEEVRSYVAERNSPVEPREFIDFYEAKGWMMGRSPMRDWKAACRSAEKWERWGRPAGRPGAEPPGSMQPSAKRIRENAEWLDRFLAEQAGGA